MARLGPAQAEAARRQEIMNNVDIAHVNPAKRAPSEKSASWFRDIMTRRQLPDRNGMPGDQRAKLALALLDAGEMTQAQVGAAIDQFKNCPLKTIDGPEGEPLPTRVAGRPARELCPVPTGRYAVKGDDGQLRFYRLKRGDRNPTYFWLYLEHGGDESEVSFGAAKGVLAQIVDQGVAHCMRMYGRHIGKCGNCGIRLTNRISRLLDTGPVCGGHMYDEEIWKAMVVAARAALRDAGLDPDDDVLDTDDLDRIRERAGL